MPPSTQSEIERMFGRVMGTRQQRVPLAVDDEGRLILAPDQGGAVHLLTARDNQGAWFSPENGVSTKVYSPNRTNPSSIVETIVDGDVTRRRTTTITDDTVTESAWEVV